MKYSKLKQLVGHRQAVFSNGKLVGVRRWINRMVWHWQSTYPY